MSGVTAFIVLQHALFAANPPSYQEALQDAQKRQQPLLVLIGAQWCPGCVTMKQQVIPSLAKRGALKPVTFTTVDYDADAATAQQLMRVGSIPQLIVYSPLPGGKWHREQLVGESTEAEVQSLISRALKAQQQTSVTQASSAAGGGGD
jgi:thioredoxin-like negative regulator of GroEL